MPRFRCESVNKKSSRPRSRPAQVEDREGDGLWAIAMLRIALELKRPGAPGLEQIIDGVVERMGLEKRPFVKYLTALTERR